MKHVRLLLTTTSAVIFLLLLGPTALAAPNADQPPPNAIKYMGFKPLNPAAYAQAKAIAQSRAPQTGSAAPFVDPASPFKPSPSGAFPGQDMSNPLTNIAPSDSTGAIGPTRYVELINQRIGVYDRNGTLLSSASLWGLTGLSTSNDQLFDVQVIWDSQTNRFYYAMVDARNNFTNNLIAWGFSKSTAPSASSPDWCHYQSSFGVYGTNAFPDYPKLGDSKNFLLIGINRFNNALNAYLGSDVIWITKPTSTATITNCPTPGLSGVKTGLKNADGSFMSTPVPANQVDPIATGWVVGTQDAGVGTGTYISLYRVKKDSNTGAAKFKLYKIPLPASQHYSMPPSAPQAGSSYAIDTSDARITQAVAAIDPRFNRQAVWAQHTVAGGAGAQIAWFEIDTGDGSTAPSLSQSGIVSHPSLYVYNGAISPDRVYRISSGTITKKFGSAMALGFNTSSASADVAIQTVSKRGLNAQSGFTKVQQSPGPNEDFTCSPCRWGDYAGASPDPAAATGGSAVTGQVWFTNQWNRASTDNINIDWTTWNWSVIP